MNTETHLSVQAYLDNELPPRDARQIATLLSGDANARALYEELKQTKELVAKNEPELRLQESREFYWSKIQRQIESAERSKMSAPAPSPWWLRLLAPMAGAVALFAILLSVVDEDSRQPAPLASTRVSNQAAAAMPIHQGEVVAPDMSAITFRSESEGVTVVWVSSTSDAGVRIFE